MPASGSKATTSSCSISPRTKRRGWIRRRPSTRRWRRARRTRWSPAIRNILGGFLFSGDDVYKRVERAVGRRTHAAGGGAHAAAAVEHAAARRADQPPRSRLEGSAARRADGLRRHADLRLARPLFRRAAGDEDHRGRPRHRARSIRAPMPSSCGTRSIRDAGRRQAGRSRRRPHADAPRGRTASPGRRGASRAGRAAGKTASAAVDARRHRPAKSGNAPTPKRKRRSRASRRGAPRLTAWNRESPRRSVPSATSKQTMARPGSTRTASPPSR